MDKTIRLTKISGEKSSENSLEIGGYADGVIKGAMFPNKPTVGLPFVINTYRTSLVKEILSETTFRTGNAVYKWEYINNGSE